MLDVMYSIIIKLLESPEEELTFFKLSHLYP